MLRPVRAGADPLLSAARVTRSLLWLACERVCALLIPFAAGHSLLTLQGTLTGVGHLLNAPIRTADRTARETPCVGIDAILPSSSVASNPRQPTFGAEREPIQGVLASAV